jgi:hypothetical protein
MARYALSGSLTAQNSATAPQINVISASTARARVYDVIVGSVATPADNCAKFQFQRSTTAGTTPTTTLVGQALDAADPAAVTTCGQGTWATPPVLTASAFLLQWSQNQRATFRWVAAPMGEILLPATAANGIALMNPAIGGSAVAYEHMVHFEE